VAVFADDVLVPDAGGAARADGYAAAGAAFSLNRFSFGRSFGGLFLHELFKELFMRRLSVGVLRFGGCRGDHGILHQAAGAVGEFKAEFRSTKRR
jgi:hypothetical protein